jgi:type VI protein secretion system component VasK
MAGESSKDTGERHVEALIDELISEMFSDSGVSADTSIGMATTAALIETAFGSARGTSRVPVLERLFLTQAFAAELADALAPALAEQLAPRLLKSLEEFMAQTEAQAEAKKPTPASRPSGPGRKTETT